MIKNVPCLWLSEALAQVSVAERGPRSGFAGTQRAKGLARLQILFAPGHTQCSIHVKIINF